MSENLLNIVLLSVMTVMITVGLILGFMLARRGCFDRWRILRKSVTDAGTEIWFQEGQLTYRTRKGAEKALARAKSRGVWADLREKDGVELHTTQELRMVKDVKFLKG